MLMRMMAMLLMIMMMMMMMMIMIIMVSNGSQQPGQRPPIVLGCNVSSLYMDKVLTVTGLQHGPGSLRIIRV